MAKAVFLDRDGVLNELVFNPATGEYESPHAPEDFKPRPRVIAPLQRLSEKGFLLFLISNQPSYAKAKTSLENLRAIHARLDGFLRENGVVFRDYYYCYHHPKGVVEGYGGPCDCRKPSPHFIRKAVKEWGVEPAASWMIGDQDTDIQCGRDGGCRTLLLPNDHSAAKRGKAAPDASAVSLDEAVGIILEHGTKELPHHGA